MKLWTFRTTRSQIFAWWHYRFFAQLDYECFTDEIIDFSARWEYKCFTNEITMCDVLESSGAATKWGEGCFKVKNLLCIFLLQTLVSRKCLIQGVLLWGVSGKLWSSLNSAHDSVICCLIAFIAEVQSHQLAVWKHKCDSGYCHKKWKKELLGRDPGGDKYWFEKASIFLTSSANFWWR